MGLTPVFKSADTYFNQDAAKRAYDLVMKMDEDEARSFCTIVAAELLWSDMDNNQRTLQRHLDEVVQKRIERVAKVLDRTYVSKALNAIETEDDADFNRDEILAYAGALAVIAKATPTPYDHGYVFQESDFRRDPSTGRFQAKVKYSGAKKPMKGGDSRKKSEGAMFPKPPKGASPRAEREYQEGYMQLANFLGTFQDSGMGGDTDFLVHFQDKKTRQRYTEVQRGTGVPKWDPETQRPIGIEARPNTLTAGGTAFGLASALGADPARGRQVAGMTQAGAQGMPSFASDWANAGRESNYSNDRLYGRVKTGSEYLETVAPTGSKLHLAAGLGKLVGEHGPQAERVLGPTARKTMYRYRGTEKTPEKELTSSYTRAQRGFSLDELGADAPKIQSFQRAALTRAEKQAGRKLDRSEQGVVLQQAQKEFEGQAEKLRTEGGRARARAVAMDHFTKKVPNKELFGLQLASGHVPPSEGIIIDANGKITTQAIGYGDDHYLPFNLKNLKGLKGGEYIRTRSVGGPTSEDIYTGLVSGARGITVVSRSGTFTMEFEEDFRGGRRYNQKAKRMVDRYEKLLDAVQSEKVERQSIPADVKYEIHEEVEQEFSWATGREGAKMKKDAIQERVDQYKSDPWISREESTEMKREALRHAGGDEKRYKMLLAEEQNARIASRAFNYKLDGNGYAAAMDALYEQFPYYLKKPVHTPKKEGRYEPEKDKGYVKPRYNRPGEALAGYYDSSITGYQNASEGRLKGTGKQHADQVDYQNRNVSPAMRKPTEETTEGAGALVPKGDQPAADKADKVVQIQQKERVNQAADELYAYFQEVPDPGWSEKGKGGEAGEVFRELRGATPEQFRSWHAKETNASRLERATDSMSRNMDAGEWKTRLDKSVARYKGAKNDISGEEYDPAKNPQHRAAVPPGPFRFAKYKPSDPYQKMQQDLKPIAGEATRHGFVFDEKQTDDDFKTQLKRAQHLLELSEALSPGEGRGFDVGSLEHMTTYSNEEKNLVASGPDRVRKQIDNLHAGWRIVHNMRNIPDSAKKAAAPHQTVPTPKLQAPQGNAPEGVEDQRSAADIKKDVVARLSGMLRPEAEEHLPKEVIGEAGDITMGAKAADDIDVLRQIEREAIELETKVLGGSPSKMPKKRRTDFT